MRLKRTLSLLLCLGVLLSAFPVAARAAEIGELWVNGTALTEENADDILGDGKVRYDAETRTLHLDEANLSQTFNNGDGHPCAVLYQGEDELTIHVSGVNTINTINNGVGDGGTGSVGIYVLGNLKLTGDGYLSVRGSTAIQAAKLVTIESEIHLAAESVSSDPIVTETSITFPSETEEGITEYNDWRTGKISLAFQNTAPVFSGGYFEMLGSGHNDDACADNGNGTHRVSCGGCGAMLVTQSPHSNTSTTCGCGVELALLRENVNDSETTGYWQLHEALAEAANQSFSSRVEILWGDNKTMPLLQSAALPAGDVLQLGTERTEGSSLSIGEGVTLTLETNSDVLLYKNTISLSGSGKVIDMGAEFGVFSYGSTQFHTHADKTKTYVNNGDGTHSAYVDCDSCNVRYQLPVNAEGALSGEHGYGADGTCTACGAPAVAKVSDIGRVTYYGDTAAAIRAWKDNSVNPGEKTLTLLADGEWEAMSYMVLPAAKRTLELNGFTLRSGYSIDISGHELIVQDSSDGAKGVYQGRITLRGDGSKLTLLSGKLDGTTGSAIIMGDGASNGLITVKGGTVTSGGSCIRGSDSSAIVIEGGCVINTSENTAQYPILGGNVRICGDAEVLREKTSGYAVSSPKVAIEGAPTVGALCYTTGDQLDLSAYTGAEQEIYFSAAYDSATGTDITLPEKYGFFDEAGNELSTMVTESLAVVKQRHEHSWSFVAEGAVITATCSESAGTCPAGNSATITLTAPANLTYDGAEKSCSVEQSVPGLFDLSGSAVQYSATPAAVGDYTASFTYEGATAELAFSIAGIDISGKSMDAIPACVYTGSAITPAVNVPGLTPGTDYDVTYSSNTNAGTATVTVSGKGNYAGTITGSFTIQPADIVIAAQLGKDAYDYTGSVVEPEVSVTTTFNGVTVNLAKDMDYSVVYGQDTAAGNIVPVTISPAANGNFRFEPVTLHYSIGKAIPVYSTPSFTATYGQTLGALALPAAENGVWSWNEAAGTPVGAVGSRSHKATFTPSDGVNYKSVTLDVAVEVAPAVLTVTGVNVANRVYDGSDQVAVSSLAIKGRVGMDDVTIQNLSTLKGTAPSANAGTYSEITLPTLSLTGAAAANYTLTQPGKMAASYTISPKPVYPIVEVAAGTYRYTGAAQTPAVTVKDGAAVIPAGEYSAVYDCNVNAGTGRVYISDVSGGNYAFSPVQGTFTIQQAVITITAENKSATTGQKAPTPSYKVTGLAPGEKLSKEPTVSYVTTPDMSKAGTAVIRAGGAVAPSANYTISYVDGTLTVTKATTSGGTGGTGGTGGYGGNVAVTVDMSGVQLKQKTYDGKPISFTGTASGRYYYGDFTYTWYTASGYKLSGAPTDAGDYTLRATVNRSGYSGYASKNVTIRKAQLTVTADDLSAAVGGEVPELRYSISGLAAGDKLKTEPQLRFETEPDMSKAGKTPILASGAVVPDTQNYEQTIKYIEGTLTVSEPGSDAETETGTSDAQKPAEGDGDSEKNNAQNGALLKVVVREGLRDTNLSEEIKASGFDSAERVEAELRNRVRKLDKSIGRKNVAYYDVQLQQSGDNGSSWQTAGADSLAADGTLPVSLPLPDGSHENCSFRIVRMQSGKAAGAVEEVRASVSRHEDGKWYLDFNLSEPSPVAVGWAESGKSGFPWWILPVGGVVAAAAVGIPLLLRRRRNDGDEEI